MISAKTLVLLCLAAMASSASGMVGGNGLCASPASLGPNASVGAYTPVDDPYEDDTIFEVAVSGTVNYLKRGSLQSDTDKRIIKTCRPRTVKVLDTVEVDAACAQVVAGKNYMVRSTFEIPCSRSAVRRLPAGVSLVRSVITEAYESLDGDLNVDEVYAAEE